MANHLISFLDEDGRETAAAHGGSGLPVNTNSFNKKFRDPFQTWPNENWSTTVNTGTGDIIMVDGNAGGASYLSVSLNPLAAGTETWIESVDTYSMPVELSAGLSISQRTLGQEFSVEVVSTEEPVATPADLTISSITQTTTTLSVTTAVAHGLRVGDRIGINGVSDSRLNYPALVVATTPTATTFTSTAGPAGTIPSLSVGPFTSGSVYFRSAMGRARNGTSLIFENATATNGAIYAKSDAGDAMPIGGTLNGNHSITLASTASIQAINAALNYAFRPTTEFRLALMADRLQWSDVGVDNVGQTTSRANLTQVVPNQDKKYKIRVRAENRKGLTVPVCHIQSVAKTGTTTATVTTQQPHGLTTGDYIAAYGVRDFTNFANLTAATVVASVIDANNFTVIWGSAVTATSQAGVIYRVNGGNLPSSLGAIAQVVQSVARTSNILTVVGSAAWSGLLIGDYVNLAALHDTGGTDLLLDGAYRVRDIQTTSLFLEPIGSAPTGIDITTTNCGGAVIKRTDLRISFLRLFDFERARVEMLSRPLGDQASAAPVVVQNTPAMTISSGTVTTVTTVGTLTGGGAAEDAAAGANPVTVGGVVRTAVAPVTLVAGDAARMTMTPGAALVVRPYSVSEAGWNASLALTTATATAIQAAAGASLKRNITALQAINTGASAVDLIILDGATERWRLTLPVNIPISISFPTELIATANTALNANLSAVGTVRANFQGYTSA